MTAASYWKFKAVNVETKSSSISQQPEQIFFIYNLIKNMENTVVYKKSVYSAYPPLLLISKKCASHFCRETANENNQFK